MDRVKSFGSGASSVLFVDVNQFVVASRAIADKAAIDTLSQNRRQSTSYAPALATYVASSSYQLDFVDLDESSVVILVCCARVHSWGMTVAPEPPATRTDPCVLMMHNAL